MSWVDRLGQDWAASGQACAFLVHMLVFLACCTLRVVAVGCAATFALEVVARSLAWALRKLAARRKPPVAPPSPASVNVTAPRGPTTWSN